MKIIFGIITLLLIISPSLANEYDSQHTLQCSNLNNSWTISENFAYLWEIIVLHEIDKFCFLVFCPIAVFIQIFIIATFCKYNLFNHSPQDIILALLLTQIVVALCYFSNAMYSVVYSNKDPMPDSFPVFCITIASINSFFGVVQKFYLIYFLIHVILNVKISIKQGKWFKGKWKHIVPFVISIVIVLISGLYGELGYSQLGICQLADTRSSNAQLYFPIVEVLFSVGFIVLAVFTYRYFKQHMPQSSALNRRKYQENLLITRYAIGISIIQGLFSAAILGLYINCHSSDPNPLVLILATVFNITRVIEFYYLIIVVLLYKKVGKKIKKFIRSCFAKKGDDSSELQTRRVTHRELFELIDIGLKQKILDILEEENQIDFIKVTQIMTILTGIRTSYREYLVQQDLSKQIKNLHYHQQVCFRIDSKWMKDYEQQALILPRLSLLDGKCTIYSPQIFKRLLSLDRVSGIDESFDLIKNSDQLYKICDNNKGGGRSGQFFFFSCDNKYILKTVNKQEFNTLLDQLQLFYNHFISNPDTLICRFYGMFKIEHKQISRKYYIILMKNISGCNKFQIRRIYDMKGSTDDRKVLKDSQDQTFLPQGTGVVYKDLDFLKLEKRLNIPNSFATQIRNQLRIDTTFLKQLNIIDYSLLVMIVDWENEPSDPNFWSRLQRVPQINCHLVYYHISLIDVSQKWDFQKKGEQWWKKILGKKDTSAQQPSFYQARFINFISEITAMGSNLYKNEEIRFEQKMQVIEMALHSKDIPSISLGDNVPLTDPMIEGTNFRKSKSVV